MTDYWSNWLTQFDQVPVVDIFGVVANQGAGGWAALDQTKRNEPDVLGLTGFDLDVWRVGEGEINTERVRMTAVISLKKFESLSGFTGHFYRNPVVHVKAKVTRNQAGFDQILFVDWVAPATDDAELNEMHRQLTQPIVLEAPPLPPLQLATYDGAWHGPIALPSWLGFYLQSAPDYGGGRGGAHLSISSAPMPAERLGYKGVPPSLEQVAAYVYLTENDEHIRDAVLQAVLDCYPQIQADYGGDYEYMPDVSHLEDLHSLLLLWDVSITSDVKDGFAYVYLSLLPNWDIEHGLGAILHKDRVVAIGHHDSIWDTAERDGGLNQNESGEAN